MNQEKRMAAAALGVLASGYVLAEAPPVPLPIVEGPPDMVISPTNPDPRACEEFPVEPKPNSSCGAVGGGGRIIFNRVDEDFRAVDSASCSFSFVNDSRTLLEKAEFPSILTSAHCLRSSWDLDRTSVRIVTEDGDTRYFSMFDVIYRSTVRLLEVDDASDLALLRIPSDRSQRLICLNPLAPRALDLESRVTGYGMPEAEGSELFEGEVEDDYASWSYSDSVVRGRGYFVRLSAGRAIPGGSGAGVYDARGRYVGGLAASVQSRCDLKAVGALHGFSGLPHLVEKGPANPTYSVLRGRLPSVSPLKLDALSYVFGRKFFSHGELESHLRVEVPARGGLYVRLHQCSPQCDSWADGRHFDSYLFTRMEMTLFDESGSFVAKSTNGLREYEEAKQLAEFVDKGTYYIKMTRPASSVGGDHSDAYQVTANFGDKDKTTIHPRFLPASDARMGFLRVINNEDEHVFVSIDRQGDDRSPVKATVVSQGARHFNAFDLQDGNLDKQISARDAWGALPTDDPWSLESRSAWDVDVMAYTRTADGMVTPAGAEVPFVKDGMDDVRDVFFFNPASNYRQVSLLQLTNLIHPANVKVRIEGMDDAGNVSEVEVSMYDNSWSMVTLTAADLEEGTGLGVSGALGDGVGKWRLRITADPEPLADIYKENPVARVVNLLESPTGHLLNLSGPASQLSAAEAGQVTKDVPLFLAVSESRMGFLRLANESDREAQVKLTAIRENGSEAGSFWIPLAPNEARHFSARDLQEGNPGKGIAEDESLGDLEDGENWRLRLESESDFEVQAYSRTEDGLVSDTTQVVSRQIDNDQGLYRVPFFNPGSIYRQRSLLRVTNLIHPEAVTLHMEGMDDTGRVSSVEIRMEERETVTLSAADLEAGMGRGLTGALHDGHGKWRLKLTTDADTTSSQQSSGGPVVRVVRVMSLLESPTGHLINLSDG